MSSLKFVYFIGSFIVSLILCYALRPLSQWQAFALGAVCGALGQIMAIFHGGYDDDAQD